MKLKNISIILAAFLLIGALVASGQAADDEIIQNAWALGVGNATGCPGDIHDGWQHSATVSLSRCPKNPSPETGEPGAAFKNGPMSGGGVAGVETTSSQFFTLPAADLHTFTFSMLAVCVRCEHITVELHGDGQLLATLLIMNEGTAGADTGEGWPRYTGSAITVPHADLFELRIRSLWVLSNSLGAKWTGLQLDHVAEWVGTATPTPLPSVTPEPSATPEPTATPAALPLLPGVYAISGCQQVVLDGFVLFCEDGS